MIHIDKNMHAEMINRQVDYGNNNFPGGYPLYPGSGNGAAEAELQFAAKHLEKIKHFPITQQDVVLVALPMSEISWLEIVEACIYRGADFILPESEKDITAIARTIRQEHITVVVIAQQTWKDVCRSPGITSETVGHKRTIFL